MAPQEEGYGRPADIWSFGITMVEIATGSAPNCQRSMDQILLNVLQSDDPTGIVDNIAHTPEVSATGRSGSAAAVPTTKTFGFQGFHRIHPGMIFSVGLYCNAVMLPLRGLHGLSRSVRRLCM